MFFSINFQLPSVLKSPVLEFWCAGWTRFAPSCSFYGSSRMETCPRIGHPSWKTRRVEGKGKAEAPTGFPLIKPIHWKCSLAAFKVRRLPRFLVHWYHVVLFDSQPWAFEALWTAVLSRTWSCILQFGQHIKRLVLEGCYSWSPLHMCFWPDALCPTIIQL